MLRQIAPLRFLRFCLQSILRGGRASRSQITWYPIECLQSATGQQEEEAKFIWSETVFLEKSGFS